MAERPSGSQSQRVRSHILLIDSMTDLISDLIMTADACTFPPSNCAGTHWDPYPTNVPTDILPRSNATAGACRVYVLQWDISAASVRVLMLPALQLLLLVNPPPLCRSPLARLAICPSVARTPPRLLRSAHPCLWHCPSIYGVAFCSVGGLPCPTC